MNCSKCGAPIPGGTNFCARCGAPIAPAQPENQATNYANPNGAPAPSNPYGAPTQGYPPANPYGANPAYPPVNNPYGANPAYPPVNPYGGAPGYSTVNPYGATPAAGMNTRPVSKLKYFFTAAPQKSKMMAFILLALGALCILVSILATNDAINGAVRDYPLISMIGLEEDWGEEEERVFLKFTGVTEDMEDEMSDTYWDFVDAFLDETYDVSLDEVQKNLNPISLKSMKFFYGMMEEEDGVAAMAVIIALMTVTTVISVVLLALATVYRQTWLLILNYVLSIGYWLLICGVGFFVIATVSYIALMVVMIMQNKEYKAYKNSCMGRPMYMVA